MKKPPCAVKMMFVESLTLLTQGGAKMTGIDLLSGYLLPGETIVESSGQ